MTTTTSPLQPITVEISDYIGPFEARTTGTTWNGAQCPLFTFDVACAIGVAMIARGDVASYDPDTDLFTFAFTDSAGEWGPAFDDDTLEYFGPITVDDAEKVYGIGYAAWTWSAIEPAFTAITLMVIVQTKDAEATVAALLAQIEDVEETHELTIEHQEQTS